ncbi:GDSL-like lipase/acylhydrolase family protein [Kordia sp. SMS9]|uniref:SGNH/GDSL hydrolase family protein n=1 Tax=Kordia sp. SMS9 TaxID=2282170 RepID=UPI000E0DCB0D|nr:GDSL-type esterase/lipase family protein [Kordia sp. SMS9]AXG69447.1 GDSL-like lipase/acylhydrolase family protein [Kordia sp. SMS9]
MKLFSKRFLKKLAFSGIATLVLLIIAEIILSLLEVVPSNYYVNTPNSSFTWEINKDEIIGIQQDSEVSFDGLGARSISDYENASHKMIVLGGSTAACFALTQEKAWPALTEKKLGNQYWVGNFGRPGNNSNHHVLQLAQLLEKPALKDTKTVLVMQGVNDLVAYLISKDRYLHLPELHLKKFAFQHVPDDHLPWYKQLTLYKLAGRAKANIAFYFNHKDHLTKTVLDIRALKKQSKIIEELPDLTAGLARYEENIKTMIQLAKSKNIRLVFVTQATMWKPNLEPQYEELMITSGFENNEAFYSTTALYGGMELFNQRLKTVCAQQNVPCIDLQLPKTTESFYDDFHFNESGAELTSEQIAGKLKRLFM